MFGVNQTWTQSLALPLSRVNYVMSLKFQLLTYKEEAANASTPEKIILRTRGNITLKTFSTMPGTGSLNVSCYGCVPGTMLNVLCLPAH